MIFLKTNAIMSCPLHIYLTIFVLCFKYYCSSRDWADPNAKNCKGQTRPVAGHNYPGGRHRGEAILDKVLGRISKSVRLLNVTALSQLRKDGHPSSYGSSKVAVDCTQWCLPGVPDAWNELLSATLLRY